MTCPRCGEANPAEIHTCSPQVEYSLHITDPREFTKEIARFMRRADAPLSDHQVVTLFHFLEAWSTSE